MLIYSVVLLLLLGGAVASLALGGREKTLNVAQGVILAASILGFGMSLYLLLQGGPQAMTVPLPLPMGECRLYVDQLSLLFLLPVFFLSGAGALILPARMRLLKAEAPQSVRYGTHCFFYCILVFAMMLVLMAADAVFFVISWELMSLAPFFLVSPADRAGKERDALWIYLVAAHLGALVLLYLFACLSVGAGSTAFSIIAAHAGEMGAASAGFLFVLALVGFGVKSGLVPLHVWMPDTYSAAPGHVAVLLCGAMVNLGLYGIVRVLWLLGSPDAWWAYTLMAAGALSGILGILLGLAQGDVKRTLAYSSAENMGIILLALGAGMLAGMHGANEAMALLWAGAFLHMWNHSLFKSLLFMSANAVQESAHDTRIHLLGGVQQRMPVAGSAFAVAGAGIAGVPPLGGFMSEMLLYAGFALAALKLHGQETALVFWGAFFVLGSIAGLAVFAFSRTYGLAFLGQARSVRVMNAADPDKMQLLVFKAFAALCFAVPLAGPALYGLMQASTREFARLCGVALPADAAPVFAVGERLLCWYALGALVLGALFFAAMTLRRRLVETQGCTEDDTWGCGYTVPSPRIQYSAASFSSTLTGMLRPMVGVRTEVPVIRELFPAASRAKVAAPDWASLLWERLAFRPVFWLAEAAKGLQAGLVNVYILYIFIALVAALVYALGDMGGAL